MIAVSGIVYIKDRNSIREWTLNTLAVSSTCDTYLTVGIDALGLGWRHFRDVVSQSVSQKSSPSSAVGVCLCSPHRVRVSECARVFAFTAVTRSPCNAERKTRQGKWFYWCCGDLCRRTGLAHCASSRQDDSLDPTAAGNVTSRLN